MANGEPSSSGTADGPEADRSIAEKPLGPSGIAQFIKHDRCPRFLKQRFDPGSEPDAREWREAFNVMNPALLGSGQEFEAEQVEALAANASKVIAPEYDDDSGAGVPAIDIDETWATSSQGRSDQLQAAVEEVETLPTDTDKPSYILCYQAPLDGKVGDQAISGQVDCLVLAPAAATERGEQPAVTDPTTTNVNSAADDTTGSSTSESPATQPHSTASGASVAIRVLEIKSARKRKPAHHVQVSIYSALLEQTLNTEVPSCRIETSIHTQETAVEPGEPLDPFALPTFSRYQWEFVVERLLSADGPIDKILSTDLDELPFSIDRVCNNCAYQEACATRAVEDPTEPASLSLLGLGPSVQDRLQEAGVTDIQELSELFPRQSDTHPTNESPTVGLPGELQRQLEKTLSGSIHETVYRAQALRGEIDPTYQDYNTPPALPDKGWIQLPDDRLDGWGNIDGAEPGKLIHVGLFVRPDTAINRVAALGGCVYAEAYDEYITISEVIDAVPDDTAIADDVEADLFDRFLTQLFDAIETVATAIGNPEESVVHCYTYSDHEIEFLAEGLDRHVDTLPEARGMRALCSLDQRGHTDVDQSMVSAIQPIITDHFALTYPSQGLLAVADQFVSGWTLDTFDPLGEHPDNQALRGIFREQFLNESVPYLDDNPGIRLHLGDGIISRSPAAEAVSRNVSGEDGQYPIRKRSGGQFPLEYIWAVTPRHPEDTTPRLTPETVKEWDDGDSDELQEVVSRFYYRTSDQQEPLQRLDVEYLIERLSYTLVQVVESIPYKNAYYSKERVDATSLIDFELPVTELPQAARDYLRMEFDNSCERTKAHYRQSLRDRARSGRSMPIRCTDIEHQADGSFTITGELAYDVLFDDAKTASQIARQTRLRSTDGPGSGSWRLITGMESTASATQANGDQTDTVSDATGSDTVDTTSSADVETVEVISTDTEPPVELTVDDAEEIKHSPPVLVDEFDAEAGIISLRTFSHRFTKNYSEFRVEHCGWDSPEGSNLDNPSIPPADRDGHVADRDPVWIDTGELYMLDPMVDDLGARKADNALLSNTIEHNALWQYLRRIRQGESPQHDAETVVDPTAIEAFLDRLDSAEECLVPNEDQEAFIEAVENALVTLHGPPGTGKTSGATAPALLGRAYGRAQHNESFVGIVVAPSHEAVDAVLNGTAEFLDDWRQTEDGLGELELVRILPSTPPAEADRVDETTASVDVTYANYHSRDGERMLQAVANDMFDSVDASQYLLFATPATLYRTLNILAETRAEIDGDSAPAAMRYPAGLADVVCIDEASMLDIPKWLLAGSTLKPSGQTLLVGDHRQLTTITETEWDETLRKPLEETKAYLSALEYVYWLDETVRDETTVTDPTASASTDGGSRQPTTQQPPTEEETTEQSRLEGFVDIDTAEENASDEP